MSADVVGRDAELASIRDFVASVSDGAAALVLVGAAGVGKTTLWNATVEEAEARDLLVLRARPSESETALSFSALGDLLDGVLEEALAPLPAGQRQALSRALVLDDDEGSPPDPHAIGVAVLNAVRTLAEARPTLIAIDDVHWIDEPSSGALAYAARRLQSERVGLLLARRARLERGLSTELRRSLPADRLTELTVGPLDAGALYRVVQSHLGTVLPRPAVAEVHEASGGNPFYALEIVRTLQRSGISIEAGHPLPVPDSLHELVHGRLQSLPPECRTFLLAAAAQADPTVALTEEASCVGRDAGLVPALEARIVELDGARIRFTHPLLAAGAYEIAERVPRRETHVRLAGLLEDPEARAWQLAAAVDQPDESVATALEEAAHRARVRGASRPAARLLDRARELTPRGLHEEANRRAIDAAFLHFQSGDSPRAEAQVRGVIAPLSPGLGRAKGLLLLARIRTYEARDDPAELFLQVVEEAEGDVETLAHAHEGVASCHFWALDRLDDGVRHAAIAFALAIEIGDEALAADALITQLGAEALLGWEVAGATVERALALQKTASDRRVLDQPLVGVAEYWMWTDSHELSRDALHELLRRGEELGDESSRPYILFLLGQVESTLGHLKSALECARDGQEAAEQSGQPLFAAYSLALEGLVQAQRGRPEQTREATNRAHALVPQRSVELVGSSALGHLELALGAPERVVDCLETTVEFVRHEAIGEPAAIRFVIDFVEALIELGRREEASELLDWYEGNARRLDRVSALAACARCRGMLAAAESRLEEALAAYDEARMWHARVEIPLDYGRTLLALGSTLRRSKRRREARETLGEARDVFERIGAALWAERARDELKRIAGRAGTPGVLTPAEERVAAIVAEGKTNREVAAALFLSQRTVEGHLSRIFGKLGVKRRTELVAALASRRDTGNRSAKDGGVPPFG